MNVAVILLLFTSIVAGMGLRDYSDRQLLTEFYGNEGKRMFSEATLIASSFTAAPAAFLTAGLSLVGTTIKVTQSVCETNECLERARDLRSEIKRRGLEIDNNLLAKLESKFFKSSVGIQVVLSGFGLFLGQIFEDLIGPSIDSYLKTLHNDVIDSVDRGLKTVTFNHASVGGQIAGAIPNPMVNALERSFKSNTNQNFVRSASSSSSYTYKDFFDACQSGNLFIVKHCVKNIAHFKVDKLDYDLSSGTAMNGLHYACRQGQIHIVKYLVLEAGADVHAKAVGFNQIQPIHLAARNGYLNILIFLVQKTSTNVNARLSDGRTALHRACQEKHLSIVQWLILNTNIDKNARDELGNTALHYSLHTYFFIKFLVQTGKVDRSIRNNQGKRPKDLSNFDIL